ncbi:uncharacterized protein METZ01_LOCUS187318 [marine metagenome]|uniref:Uncharacterized protein n=1 Tax=marine metagenome TaxID=408172 RepID=A0A382D8V0_9ZZZZ
MIAFDKPPTVFVEQSSSDLVLASDLQRPIRESGEMMHWTMNGAWKFKLEIL